MEAKIGYFSNGTEGMMYEEAYCDRCVHQNGPDGKSGCAIWAAHLRYNYEHCNDEDSILHFLIPRTKDDLGNEQCRLFADKGRRVVIDDTVTFDTATAYLNRNNRAEALLHLGRALGGDWEAALS